MISARQDERFRTGDWTQLAADALAVRLEVFVAEQQVPLADEVDEYDPACVHVVVYVHDLPVATGRLRPDGYIGRLAVRRPWRATGLGGRVLDHLLALGWQAGHAELKLAAQCQARNFYRKRGFVEYGEVFDDAGIEHIMMRLGEQGT
ncbi:GNAT family N-acetyltransferase [Alcaligenes sp. SDU_A2]|uniref:GNAT family N-acetyltransferase n=1 Tax=Alcaligenes sp. SDU_A2 TaxID=3136634 RepID=UPI00311F340D